MSGGAAHLVSSLPAGVAAVVEELVRRIVAVARPRRILLFGSAARGEMRPGSDLDLLVVVNGPVHRRALAQEIYRSLHGLVLPVDLAVATEDDLIRYADRPETALRYALCEGVILYDADN